MTGWRAMRPSDVDAANALGSDFHIHHPEGSDILPQRLRLAPEWCFTLDDADSVFAGYAVSHPWGGALPPGLDMHLDRLPVPADTIHLHDIVLMPAFRRQGHAERLVARLMEQAGRAGLRRLTLIAVGDAGPYWARREFIDDPDPARVAFARNSYGPDATPMARAVPPIAGA